MPFSSILAVMLPFVSELKFFLPKSSTNRALRSPTDEKILLEFHAVEALSGLVFGIYLLIVYNTF
jgi:hypothetical protein